MLTQKWDCCVNGYTELDVVDNFVPALVATSVWVAVGVALDVYLVSTNRSHLITDILRTKPGKVGLAVLCLHVVNVLGRVDPFRAAAYALQVRKAVLVSELTGTSTVSK